MTGGGRIGHLGEFLKPLVRFTALESVDIWATSIDSFAGLWGVGLGGIFLPQLRRLKLRVCVPPHQKPCAVFAANPADRVVDAFAGTLFCKSGDSGQVIQWLRFVVSMALSVARLQSF